MGRKLKYSPIVSNLPSKSDTILFKLDMNVLKDLKFPNNVNGQLQAEVAAKIEKIPKFSTFTRCKVV
jgi:hypothetical protein